jgi:Carboxypeptidase regulatory-like domain
MEPACVLGRPIHMRIGAALVIALTVSSLTACGAQSAGPAGDRSGVTGRVRLGPQCPVEREGDPCPDEPAADSWVTVATQQGGDSYAGGHVVARTTTDANGRYRVDLPPGRYVVTAQAGMSCELAATRVTSGAFAKVDIPCDTGIR